MTARTRIAAIEATRAMRTTSDKIRTLAAGGYLRTEISKLLGIRYQHVRKVLVDAGFEGGFQRADAAALPTEAVEEPDAPQEDARVAALDVIQGLRTTSDRIRALAKAGYLRTEISNLLGIRYQHVRNVLVRTRAGDGFQQPVEMELSADTVEVQPDEREPVPPGVLVEAGFRRLGTWHLVDGQIILDAAVPREAGVYAFVLDGNVVYIGVTQTGLRTRMGQYRHGHEGQKTSSRINGLIRTAIETGQTIDALIALPPALEWNGLPVNGAAGLEIGLIEMIQPVWNKRGVTTASA